MPIFFLVIGIMLIVVAINDKMPQLGSLVKDDFQPSSGDPGFAAWIIALFVIGSLGYVKALRPLANSFLVLVVLVMFLSNQGFFAKFTSAIQKG